MTLTATIKDDTGNVIGVLVLNEKQFKTGNTGFFGQGKLDIGGKRYQCQAQAVLIKGQEPQPE
jgi:hypothetical protein